MLKKLKTADKVQVPEDYRRLSLPLSDQPPEVEDGFDRTAKRGPHDDGLFEHGTRKGNDRVLLG